MIHTVDGNIVSFEFTDDDTPIEREIIELGAELLHRIVVAIAQAEGRE